MKTPFVEKITAPVKPGELLFAMNVIGAVGDGNNTPGHRFVHGLEALRECIADEGKAASLHTRSWALTDMVQDGRIEEWRNGRQLHPAVLVATAELEMTDNGGFDPGDFFSKVKMLAAQYSTDELNAMLTDRPQMGFLRGRQTAPPRITGNDYCPCKSGKKYKKCHGMPK